MNGEPKGLSWVQVPSHNGSPSATISKLRRNWKTAALLLTILATIFYVLSPHPHTRLAHKVKQASYFKSNAAGDHHPPNSKEAIDFWREVAKAVLAGKPSFTEVKRLNDDVPWIEFKRENQDSKRPELLDVSPKEIDELKQIHAKAKETFAHLAPRLPFVRGTRGIISTANNDALAIQTSALWMMRSSGSTLPVEVWFFDYESWEDDVCNEIYPSLGAKCMFMIDYIPPDLGEWSKLLMGNKFVFKTLTILFSSFEQTLFLDCDAFPVLNPDSIFETEPFNSTGLVLWPDYWANTASKEFYEIVGRPVPELTERAASESGQILINKATHAAPILLANFYNTWGVEYWYRLWSQAAPGEGDKEGYLAAAQDYDMPHYQVNETPQRVGYKCEDQKHAIGSAQSHPHDDYLYTVNNITRAGPGFDLGESIHPRILFIHANMPKPDPYMILEWDIPELNWEDMLRCEKGKGKVHRMWGPEELAVVKYGWDPERALWDGMRWEACVHETGYKFWITGSIFRPEEQIRHDLCDAMTDLWNKMFPGETWSSAVPQPGHREERPWGGWGKGHLSDGIE